MFRRWRRPTVRAGGTLRTAVGELSIHEVAQIDLEQLDDRAAQRAGYADVAALLADLLAPRPAPRRRRTAAPHQDSPVYRVRVSHRGEDPRVALRGELLGPQELAVTLDLLRGIDARAARPWARQALGLIEEWPARRAPELAELAGWRTAQWKARVRRLKELGLTQSLAVGYRLSPRGEQVARELRRAPAEESDVPPAPTPR